MIMAPSLLSLHEDVLLEIWSNFDVIQLSQLRVVCTKFKEISESKLLCQTQFSCNGYEQFARKTDFFVKYCPNIRCLSVSGIADNYEVMLTILKQRFTSITSFSCTNCDAIDDNNLKLVGESFPTLTKVTLNRLKVTDDGLERLVRASPRLESLHVSCINCEGIWLGSLNKTIKELKIIDCEGLTMDGFRCFFDGDGKHVESLTLTKSRKDQLDQDVCNNILDELPNLRTFVFKSYDLKTIQLSTEKLRSLRHFHFRAFGRIQTNICGPQLNLKTLSLALYETDDGELGTMLDKASALTSLEISVWREVNCWDETINAITEMSNLTTLKTNVKNHGQDVTTWFDVFEACESLKDVHLCKVTDEDRRALISYLQSKDLVSRRKFQVYASKTVPDKEERMY